jgi:hypothetical protein
MEGDMGFVVILSAFLPIILVCTLILSVLYVLKSSWFCGFTGEMRFHIFARTHLDKDKYHVLRNVTLPTADGTVQIDHIIVSEYGVFVIETKNMKGGIVGGARHQTWTQKIFKSAKTFPNPLHQNDKHVETLKSILELSDKQIFSIVVFMGSTFKTEMPENVINGPGLIKQIKSRNQQVLLGTDVQMILSKIEAERLVPWRETAKEHPAHGKQMVEEKQNSDPSSKCKMNAAISSSDDGWILDFETEAAFSDSWENRSWRFDDTESTFQDSAIQ